MAGHTGGEWRFDRHRSDSPYLGNITAYLGKTEYGSEQIRTITCQLKYATPEENLANSRLIAAAPDMAKAGNGLRNAVKGLSIAEDEIRQVIGNSNWNVLQHWVSEMDAAIAKAEATK